MGLLALGVLAIVLGFIHSWIEPRIVSAIPAAVPAQNMVVKPLITGGVILIALFAANLIVGAVGLRGKG
jgi:hypothetical protein